MIHLIGGQSGALRAWLFSHVAESRDAGRRVILFVPEQYTLQAERELLTGMELPGLLDLDVVSPTRLKALVREAAGSSGRRALDEHGRAMAVHQALNACGELTFYRRLGRLYGAVPRLEKTLSDFREEGVTPDALEALSARSASGVRRAKFHDLGLILSAYERLLGDRFDDPASAWQDVCARLAASGLWQGIDLYVYGFDTLRPDLRHLLLALVPGCANISVLLAMQRSSDPAGWIFRVQRESVASLQADLKEAGFSAAVEYLSPVSGSVPPALAALERSLFGRDAAPFPEDPAPAVSLFAAPHPTGEAFRIVSVLRAWHREGIPWNRMAIALSGGDTAAGTLTSVLRMNGIPFFYSRKDPVSRHGACRLLTAALDVVSSGPRTASLLEAAASGFGVLSREEGIRLGRYAAAHGIDRGRWRRPFTRGDDAPEMESLRLRLLAPIQSLHDRLRGARDAAAGVEAVFRFLEEEGVHAQLLERQSALMERGLYAEAVVDRQVWNTLMDLLDQLYGLLGGQRPSLKETAMLITGALERCVLSSIPEEEEGVTIGEIGHMLPGRTDALILPGMNDGVMNVSAAGILSDSDLREMESASGQSVGLDQKRMSAMIHSDYYRTMVLPARHLFVSFRLRDESGSSLQPGLPVSELRRIFPALRQEGGLTAESPLPETPSLALAGLGSRLTRLRDHPEEDLSAPWRDALRRLLRRDDAAPAALAMMRPLLASPGPRSVRPDTALRLYHGDRVSVSRLECYASCPYKHFLRYGLRPLIPAEYVFSPADAGDFFHSALDKYLGLAMREPAWPSLPEERVTRLMDLLLSDLTAEWMESPLAADAPGRWQEEEYLRRVRRAASVLTRFAANSDFVPIGTEIPFGEQEGDPPLVLTLSDGARVALRGKIDRLDRCDCPEGTYLRVLDLKSGGKDLNPAKMLRGEQLQLMIYLRAALRNHPGALPAGALYFPVQDPEISAETPEEAEEKRLGEVRMRGVVNREESVLRAMDRDVSPFSIQKVFNQDGSLARSARWALETKELLDLAVAAEKRAASLCEEIRSGAVPVSPSVENDRMSACTFCEFSSICPKRREDGRPLPEGVTFADVAALAGQ